jgi:hypothetical protein
MCRGVMMGQSLDTLVQKVHKNNAVVYGWGCAPLIRGAFGYDNLCSSIMKFIEVIDLTPDSTDAELNTDPLPDGDALAAAIHDGWAENYIYWRDNKPYLRSCLGWPMYRRPAQPLGDDRRNLCAASAFAALPADEQMKDRVIAQFLLEIYRDRVRDRAAEGHGL